VLLTRYVTETDSTAITLPDMERMRLERKARVIMDGR